MAVHNFDRHGLYKSHSKKYCCVCRNLGGKWLLNRGELFASHVAAFSVWVFCIWKASQIQSDQNLFCLLFLLPCQGRGGYVKVCINGNGDILAELFSRAAGASSGVWWKCLPLLGQKLNRCVRKSSLRCLHWLHLSYQGKSSITAPFLPCSF